MRDLRVVIDEALLLAQYLAKQASPLARDMTFLQQWIKRPDMGYVYLLGADSDVYEKPDDLTELIAVKRHRGHNLVARIVADFGVRIWRRVFLRKVCGLALIVKVVSVGFFFADGDTGACAGYVCEHDLLLGQWIDHGW
jgi:hypothetical protein